LQQTNPGWFEPFDAQWGGDSSRAGPVRRSLEGAYADLKASHRELDAAVAACYGWTRSVAEDPAEITQRLLRLNGEIASGERPYQPFATRAHEGGGQQLSLEIAVEHATAQTMHAGNVAERLA
jgi:hypothetical protein